MKSSKECVLAMLLAGTSCVTLAADAAPPPAAPPPAAAEALKALEGAKPPPAKEAPKVEYYVSIDGKQSGPFPCAKVLEMAKARAVTPETKVWKAGMESWQRAASIEEFRPIFAVVPPPVDGDLPRPAEFRYDKVPTPCPPPDDGKAPWWWPIPWWPFKL